MKLYISGPMSGMPDHGRPAFFYAAGRLLAAGYQIVNPAALQEPVEGKPWEAYLRVDLMAMLDGCEGVALLDGHERSRGARLERHVAEALKMPVKPVDVWVIEALADTLGIAGVVNGG